MMKTKHPYHKWTYPQLKRASALWAEVLSLQEIADALGRTRDSIREVSQRHRALFPYRTKEQRRQLIAKHKQLTP